jgi:hypothetical protein
MEQAEIKYHKMDQHPNRVSQKYTPDVASYVSRLLHARTVQPSCTGVPNTHTTTSRFKWGGIYMYHLLQQRSEQFS